MGPRVLPAASPRPGGHPHPTRQRAAQGLGLGSQGCCDQVPRVSRHQTAFAHSSGGKEPQAKVSSGLVPPEALKDLALVPPSAWRLRPPSALAGSHVHPRPLPPPSPGLPRSVRVCVSPAPDGSAGHCSRDPPHANAVTSAKAPLRRGLGGDTLPASADAGAGVGGTGPGCLGGSPLQPQTLGALVAVTVTAAGPPPRSPLLAGDASCPRGFRQRYRDQPLSPPPAVRSAL